MKRFTAWKRISFISGIDSDRYLISHNGKVKSMKTNKIISSYISNRGYEYVGLYCDCIKKNVEVHRLVAMAFIPNKCAKPEVNHKDGVRNHNCVSNLEWATRSENQKDQRKRNNTQKINNYCKHCGVLVSKGSILCRKCRREKRRENYPTRENLISMIEKTNGNFLALGRHYGVSDNAVRKWCSFYKIHNKHGG